MPFADSYQYKIQYIIHNLTSIHRLRQTESDLRLCAVVFPLPRPIFFLHFHDDRISAVEPSILQRALVFQPCQTLVGIIQIIVPQANFAVCRNAENRFCKVLQLPYNISDNPLILYSLEERGGKNFFYGGLHRTCIWSLVGSTQQKLNLLTTHEAA